MDQMKYTDRVHDIVKPYNQTIREFYKIQGWKNVNCIFPTYNPVPENT